MDYESLLGRMAPDNTSDPKPYTLNTPIEDMRDSFIGRFLEKKIRKQIKEMMGGQTYTPKRLMMERSALENPLRLLVIFSGGALHRETLEGLLDLANGKVLKGIKKILRRKSIS